jgi:cytochrome oxidase assembly protein ShyY1
VSVSGHYVAAQQVLVVAKDGTGRVLTAFQLADGRVVAIARGVGTGREVPPSGDLTQTGVFLPTEAASDWTVPAGAYGSVRLQALAQVWPQPVVSGYVTLDAAEAQAQGLAAAAVVLPTLDGQFRNAGYALQWWAFAAFALVMSVLIARNYRRRGMQLSDGD